MEYPPGFLLEEFAPPLETGELFRVRFYDQRFEGKYPDGQLGIGVYAKDADSLEAWLAKHSSPGDSGDDGIYYPGLSKQNLMTTNGRPAVAFDWDAVTVATIHDVAFFRQDRVITMSWYGNGKYQPLFDRMLDSYAD